MILVPEDIWPCLKTFLIFINGDGDGGVHLVDTAPKMFLNILLCTGQPPTTKNCLTQNITVVKPESKPYNLDTILGHILLSLATVRNAVSSGQVL